MLNLWSEKAASSGKKTPKGIGFVAIAERPNGASGTTNAAVFSEDGINWISTTLSASRNWRRLAFGKGRFVAVGAHNRGGHTDSVYSDDGINWKTSTLPTSGWGNDVVFGKNAFVVVSQNGNIAYSEDGVNWTKVFTCSNRVSSIAFGNGKFVVAADGDVANENAIKQAYYSEDGRNWVTITLPMSKKWLDVTFGKGKFIMIAADAALSSTDGVNWESLSITSDASMLYIFFENGRFFAICGLWGITKSLYSDDGINWKEFTFPYFNGGMIHDITYGKGRFIAVGEKTKDTGANVVLSSTDGVNWETVSLPTTYMWNAVKYG